MWNLLIINPMVNILLMIYNFIGNFGISIILFTLLIRLITHPLTVQQIKGGQKLQELQRSKEYQDMQKKYKDDKAKLQQEQMNLYKEMGINPFSSCLPTLLQFPIIIGLYQAIIRVLGGAPVQLVDLYTHVYRFPPFDTLIPISKLLLINNYFLGIDLSQAFGYTVAGFAVAIFVAGTTFLQSRLMTPPTQPGEQGAQMTQAMNMYMPLLMGYLTLTFAAGLSLYFVTSNVITIIQYAAMGKLNWKNLIPGQRATAPAAIESGKTQKPVKSTKPKTKSSK